MGMKTKWAMLAIFVPPAQIPNKPIPMLMGWGMLVTMIWIPMVMNGAISLIIALKTQIPPKSDDDDGVGTVCDDDESAVDGGTP